MTVCKAFVALSVGIMAWASSACHETSRGRQVRGANEGLSLPDSMRLVPSPDEVVLGARLFADVNLSRDSTTSCATCHSPFRVFSEPREVSHGIGLHARKRNTPSLVNVAIRRPPFDWDGRAGTLEDQLRGVFSVDGDMGIDLVSAVAVARNSPYYDSEFRRVYGRPVDVHALAAAIIVFQRTLTILGSRFDRYYLESDSTALSPSEKRGWALFRSNKAGCAGCHIPFPDPETGIILFEDIRFHNLGVGYNDGRMEDVGRYGVTRRPGHWGSFRTPSLRNVALTSPYMHDGSLATLEEVVDFYAKGGIRNPNLDPVIGRRNLSQQDRADLVAFLRSLTTEWLMDSSAVQIRLLRSTTGDMNLTSR